MSVIELNYTKYRDMMVPMIPIKMKCETEDWLEFWAFVDSGATYSIFSSKEAEGLGIEIKQGKRLLSKGPGNQGQMKSRQLTGSSSEM